MPDGTRLPAPAATETLDRFDVDLFVASFLSRYDGKTRERYTADLCRFLEWCDRHHLSPFQLRRQHLEVYAKYLAEERGNCPTTVAHRLGTLRLFYELAVDDDLIIKNPTRLLRIPKRRRVVGEKIHLNRAEMQAVARAAYDSSPVDYALVVIMGYTGMRVSEVCSLDVEHVLSFSKGHRVMEFVQKGGDIATVPQPPVVMRAIDAVIAGRTSGPLLLRRDGTRMTRRSADRVVKRVARVAGIAMTVSPHTFRYSFCVNSIDAGVPLREVQVSMRHKDISTTISVYDRGRANLDTHASHTLAAYLGAVA
ncbi:tyrosine-type recombinase/integrase [Rhodococcoides corynebacterioides]|uniref:tyrosine-type recombinase/integrase n=1 Tax=Rhodococcoides corynebacterioides TaxID=53972 RepID=UPI003F7F2794